MTILNMVWWWGGWQSIKVPLNDITTLSATEWDTEAYITWTDVWDLTVNWVLLNTWNSTKLVRKVGSAPSDSSDGTLVYTETVADTYSVNPYTDTWLTNGTTYYYKAFSVGSNWLESGSNSVSIVPSAWWQPWADTIAYYPLTSQTTVYDQSGNNHTLTEYHSATPWTVSYWTYWWVDCCYINIWELSTNITSYTWPRTVLGWYQQVWQPNNDSSWIFGYGNNGSMGGWWWIIINWKTRPATDKVCWLADGVITWSTSLSLNTWYFLAMTLDWTRNIWAAKIYVNGQLDGQNTGTLWISAPTTNRIWISGDSWDDRSMIWYVSKVIFEKREWTAWELLDYFNATKSNYWY